MAKGKYQKWLEPDALILLEGWARDGLTDEQIAKKIGISKETFYQWKAKYTDFSDSITRGKEVTDYIVENALYKSALGYTVKLKKPIKVKTEKSVPGKGKIVEEHIEYAEEEVHIPANTQAQQFWLKNRQPDKWRHNSKDKMDILEQEARIEQLKTSTEHIKQADGKSVSDDDGVILVHRGGDEYEADGCS